MNLCPSCSVAVQPGARFCHNCGDNLQEKIKICPVCYQKNPQVTVICHHCNHNFSKVIKEEVKAFVPEYKLTFSPDTLNDEIKGHFFKTLKMQVEEQFKIARYSEYLERFYSSDFHAIFAVRANQIAEDVLIHHERFKQNGLKEIDRKMDIAFDGLLDYFFIRYCQDLNGFHLPETILKYERYQQNKTDMWTLISDFLDFEYETEVFHFDFIRMPKELLQNACKNFLKASTREKLYFVCDFSLNGSCKEGLAMTNQGIYWKMPFDKPKKVVFSEINTLTRKKEWLMINGNYLTVNPCFDIKLLKLLKKLKNNQVPEINVR